MVYKKQFFKFHLSTVQRIALYVFFFSINFEVWDPFNTGFFSIAKLTGFVYLLTITPRIGSFIRVDTIVASFIRPVWLFFGLLTLVSIFNISHPFNNFFNVSIFQNIILFLFLINHERKEPLVLEKGLLYFALGSVALALLFSAGIGVEYDEGGRVRIFGDNPNSIALNMCISMTILALVIAQNRLKFGRLRYLLLLLMPMMLELVFQTASRVALISLILVFITGLALFKTKTVWRKIALLIIGTFVVLYGLQVVLRSEVLLQRLLESYYNADVAGRREIWEGLLPLIESNPVFGVGETGYAYFAETTFGGNPSPHNVILEVLCYTGIVGLIIYLIFQYRIFISAYKKYKAEGLLLSLLLLIPVYGMILSGQILLVKIGWCIFAYIIGTSVVNRGHQI